MGSPKKFKNAVLGGTFDHFHKGHKNFLKHGLSLSKRLVVGVTSDTYIRKLKIKNEKLKISTQSLKVFESFRIRLRSVEKYLKKNAPDRYEIVKIHDMYGTTLNKDFQAETIVVSEFTKRGAEEINRKRKEKGLKEFKILVCPEVLAQDGKPVSSFRIRNGEIDRDGKLYIESGWFSESLIITDGIRKKLKRPLGKLLKDIRKDSIKNYQSVITVGDIATKRFLSLGIMPNISAIDFRVARKKRFKNIKELGFLGGENIIKVDNPSGYLTSQLFKGVLQAIKSGSDKIIIQVNGEEDLSVLPAVLAAPLGWIVYYGQPGRGIVKILVDEKNKAKIHEIVASFNTRGY